MLLAEEVFEPLTRHSPDESYDYKKLPQNLSTLFVQQFIYNQKVD